jgi:hypothetical protein
MVHTPFARATGGRSATAFAAPRILNALIGCRFSSLSQISGTPSSPCRRRISGVRVMTPRMRSRAARISSMVTGRTGGGAVADMWGGL